LNDIDNNGAGKAPINNELNYKHPGTTTKQPLGERNGEDEITDDDLIGLRESVGNFDIDEVAFITNFNFQRLQNDNINFFVKGIPYVFMTGPVLNLCEANVSTDSFLTYMATSTNENKEILRHLTNENYTDTLFGDLGGKNCDLIPLITNTALSIDIKDTVARTKEVGETFYGYKQVHPGSLVDSIVGDEISIKYLEMTNLPILKMHKAWQDYIEKVRRGQFIPSRNALDDGFIDYMASIYYILCDFDGETIKYWAKYTGVAPLNVPYSSLGGDLTSHEVPDITINYSYCYKEDMSVAILRDFNRIVGSVPITMDWDENGMNEKADDLISGSLKSSVCPTVISYQPETGGYGFKLVFDTDRTISEPTKSNYSDSSSSISSNSTQEYLYGNNATINDVTVIPNVQDNKNEIVTGDVLPPNISLWQM